MAKQEAMIKNLQEEIEKMQTKFEKLESKIDGDLLAVDSPDLVRMEENALSENDADKTARLSI